MAPSNFKKDCVCLCVCVCVRMPPLEVRPSSVAPDPAESRGAPPPPQDPSPLRSLHSGGPGEERWDAREALLHVFNPQEDLEQDQQEAGGGLEAPPPPSLKFRDGCWAAGSEPPAHRADLKSYHCRPLPAPPVIQLPPGRAAPGKSGLHARGEGERVLTLESRDPQQEKPQ